MKTTKGMPHNIIAAIDIGTTKICVLVAQQVAPGEIDIIGIGKAPSQGLARGVVVNIGPAVQSIKTALKEAELMSGIQLESAAIGISGSHIQARNSQGVVPIKHGEIRQSDVTNVISSARAIALPEGQQILHVLPQYYTIDGTHQVKDPIGMFGIRLETEAHIISGALASVQNLIRCCEMAGIKARDIVLEPIASAEAVLSEDERELGAFMLDIGGGTSDFAYYEQGTIRHTKVIPLAGNIFTQDIALCLRTTMHDAERIKREFASTLQNEQSSTQEIEIEQIQGEEKQMISKEQLAEIVHARAHELFTMVGKEIKAFHLQAPAGLILTGGGALLDGLRETASDVLQMPVRVGRPKINFGFKDALDSPSFATSYGLLLYAVKKHKMAAFEEMEGPLVSKVFGRMKSWVFDLF